ncbi:TPA: DUF905 domain-containing protein [Escherichia coli]|jgi:hypothetical protein|nr:DUF905 domain-containing protein [Escherichia coli]EFN7249978.1 DUF905 domain-containing protein [Escherichia coli O2:H14]EFB3196844.1 DUF905 domain-containing protein [Escherichia coli]EFB4741853.1 DUF905 domain-containing protein [Escherichia coli]EFB8221479.1 DUF905 domain-containing protein [Escherichia coli]
MPLKDCKHIHFSPAIRCSESWMVWRAWCFEPDAGEGLNRYIRKSGILLLITPILHPCMSFISHAPTIVAGVFIDGEYP